MLEIDNSIDRKRGEIRRSFLCFKDVEYITSEAVGDWIIL